MSYEGEIDEDEYTYRYYMQGPVETQPTCTSPIASQSPAPSKSYMIFMTRKILSSIRLYISPISRKNLINSTSFKIPFLIIKKNKGPPS